MKYHWTTMFCAISLLAVPLFGCGDNEAPPEEEVDPYERPDEAREIITDEQLERLEEVGAEVHGGSSPPNIEGTYFFGDQEIVFTDSDKYPGGVDFWCHRLVTLEQGDTPEAYESSLTSPNCDWESEGTAVYISGEGNCFTLYSSSSGTFEGCYQEGVGITSACLNEDGDMVEPVSGGITTVVEESSECDIVVGEGRTLDEGELAISEQVDDMAERRE